MPRFFVEEPPGEIATIYGDDARHIIKSLRMQVGEELTLCDLKGYDYLGVIDAFELDFVRVRILSKAPTQSETLFPITLYQALPKGEKLEFIVQKATELGVCKIVPVITARCISRPLERSMERKAKRLQKIAYEAAKQSGRGLVPQIAPMLNFADALEAMGKDNLAILFYEEASIPLQHVLAGQQAKSTSIMVGSEGGFSAKEIADAANAGIGIASLGRRILRCETAPVCALAAILYHFGEF